MKKKETAIDDFFEMICQSWTWARLRNEERERFTNAAKQTHIFGTWEQRWYYLNDMYRAFLEGTGYNYIGWREA